nr:MAG TPA: hypothetical protein [Caudoviricetes sp.]
MTGFLFLPTFVHFLSNLNKMKGYALSLYINEKRQKSALKVVYFCLFLHILYYKERKEW